MYAEAYAAHYNGKNFDVAANGYLKTMLYFPDSNEARYAKQQIENLMKSNLIDFDKLDDEVKALYKTIYLDEESRIAFEEERKIKIENERAENEQRIKEEQERERNFLMTTSNNFDGYVVERYIDIVCEDVIFKNSLKDRLSASLDNFVTALNFNETEYSGSSELIRNAREYVVKKIKNRAVKMGANAMLGIDFETSFGSAVVRVAVSGTAVLVKKINIDN